MDNKEKEINSENTSDNIIHELPDWNIEPPVQIQRGDDE